MHVLFCGHTLQLAGVNAAVFNHIRKKMRSNDDEIKMQFFDIKYIETTPMFSYGNCGMKDTKKVQFHYYRYY